MPKPKQLQDHHDTRFKSNLHGVSELSARISRVLGSNSSTQRAARAFKPQTVRSLPKNDIESSNKSQLGLAKDFKNAELSKHEDSFFKRAGGDSKKSINSQSHRNSKGQVIKLSAAYFPSHPASYSVLPGDKVADTDLKENQMTPVQEPFRIRTQKSPVTAPKSVLYYNESKMVSERTVAVHSTSKLRNPAKKGRFGAEHSPDTTRAGQQSAVTARAAALISTYESAKQMASSARKQLANLPVLGVGVNPHLKSYLQQSQSSEKLPKTTFEQNFEDGQELFDSKGRLVAGPQEPVRRQSKQKSVRDAAICSLPNRRKQEGSPENIVRILRRCPKNHIKLTAKFTADFTDTEKPESSFLKWSIFASAG